MQEISVIMPVYNEAAEWVRESIDSILNQTFSDFEFIIVLDNPENIELESLLIEYSRKDRRIKLIKNKKNIGLVSSLNKGLSRINGKFIARMDADDISLPDRLEKQLNFLKKNPEVKLVGSNWKCIDEESNILFEHGKLPTKYNFIRKNIQYNNMFLHPSWMFRVEILKDIHGYREMTFCEDYDFITRLLTEGVKISNINEFLILYRVRNSSISISKAYEQYVNSSKVIEYMKERGKTGKDSFFETANTELNLADKNRYLEATQNFIDSRAELGKKNIMGFGIKFLKSFITSKHRAKKNVNIIIYNIKCFLLKPYN